MEGLIKQKAGGEDPKLSRKHCQNRRWYKLKYKTNGGEDPKPSNGKASIENLKPPEEKARDDDPMPAHDKAGGENAGGEELKPLHTKPLAAGLKSGTLRGRSALPQSTLENRSSLCM